MARIEGAIFCDNCGVEITWSPWTAGWRDAKFAHIPASGAMRPSEYCCQTCFEGHPCHCGERMELEDERRQGAGTQVSGSLY